MANVKFSDVVKFYIGCKCETPWGEMTLTGYCMFDKFKMWFDNNVEANKIIAEHDSLTARSFFFDEVKPILRRLSSMTEEEMKELYELVFLRKFGENGSIRFYDSLSKNSKRNEISRWVLWSGAERLGIQLNGDVWADSDLDKWNFNPHEVTRWLLSKHFDLFSLLDNGEAIEK